MIELFLVPDYCSKGAYIPSEYMVFSSIAVLITVVGNSYQTNGAVWCIKLNFDLSATEGLEPNNGRRP